MRQALAVVLLFLAPVACSAQVDLNKLKLPPGFRINVFAETKQSPRFMAFSPGGVLLVTSDDEGTVLALPDPKKTGRAERIVTVLSDLNGPHGINFHKGKLYVGEVDKLVAYDWDEANLRATNSHVVTKLPSSGGGHITRTVIFHDGKMYVSAGSSCNVCRESDPRRAAVMEYNEDGSGERIFARGLRNSVGLAVNPVTKTIWATENGRDWLGDDLPPEEINDLANGGDFGWPYCYGNRVPDTKFSSDAGTRCASTVPARVEMQAHSAPLGLAFYTASMFPAEYRGDLFVAFHGSWNRSVPTGYKIVRVKLNEKSEPEGVEDFITGWMPPNPSRGTKWMGRPVGIVIGADGLMYLSDDGNGAIYRVTWASK